MTEPFESYKIKLFSFRYKFIVITFRVYYLRRNGIEKEYIERAKEITKIVRPRNEICSH